jgi:hypothetical protein
MKKAEYRSIVETYRRVQDTECPESAVHSIDVDSSDTDDG